MQGIEDYLEMVDGLWRALNEIQDIAFCLILGHFLEVIGFEMKKMIT